MSNDASGILGRYIGFLNRSDSKDKVAALLRSPLDSRPSVVTSRMENEVVGTCPYCGQKMKTSSAANETVYLCEKDRYVAPRPNSELESSNIE